MLSHIKHSPNELRLVAIVYSSHLRIGLGGSSQSSFNVTNGTVVVVSDGEDLRVWCDYDGRDWEVCLWYRPNTNR